MPAPKFTLNGNLRIFLAVLIPLLIFAFGYGSVTTDVKHNEEAIARIEVKLDRIINMMLEQP